MIRPPVAVVIAAITFAAPLSALAQEPVAPYFEIGLDPAAVVTSPIGTLRSVRGSLPCRETYEGSTRVNLGVLGWLAWVLDGRPRPLGELTIRSLRLSAGIDDLSSVWTTPSESYEAYDDIAGRYTAVETQFTADFQLRALRTAIELESSLGANIALRLGPSIAIPMSASSEQRESILSPSSATFLDRTQERDIPEGTGTIDDAGVRVGVGAAVSYRLPLGRRLFFEPTAAADIGLTSMQPEWTPLELRLGIGIGWALFADPEPIVVAPPVREPVIEPVRETPPKLAASIDARLASDSPIELRRQIVARYTPVIPVVFFDRDARTLPVRYRQLDGGSTEAFDESAISTSADAAHLDVLNVLGSRLLVSRASVTLTGTTSDEESDREALARARVEAVAAYLETVWSIPRSRMTVRSRLAPAVPTSSATEEGRAENRRVEIAVSDESLLSPVQQRTVEPVVEPRAIAFRTSVDANMPIAGWTLSIGGASGKSISGVGVVPESVTWELTQEERERLLAGGSAEYQLMVTTAGGESATSTARSIPLRLDTTVTVATSATRPDNAAEFLLITFEFDQARLTDRGRRELETIGRRIGPESRVSVTGYTDRIGESGHNLALARERAERVAEQLPKGAALEVRGADQTEAPYTNDTPEGRFLSRTVRVVIAAPR
jgi:outer membrane protein OmpA-like peptidoglycan-associated protein